MAMARFTGQMTLGEILSDPIFDGFRDHFFYHDDREQARTNTKLDDLAAEARSNAFDLKNYFDLASLLEQKRLLIREIRTGVNYFAFLTAEKNRPLILVIPGGGYEFCSHPNEGFSTAIRLVEAGYNAFVIDYGVGKEARYPQPVEDVVNALRDILKNAAEFGCDAKGFGILGFSAGGHLAAICSRKDIGFAAYGLPRPRFQILGYPVITMEEFSHKGSQELFLGEALFDKEKRKLLSADTNIDSDYPPTYICGSIRDTTVNSINFQMMDEALEKAGIRHHLRLVDSDWHGFGTGDKGVAPGWIIEALDWLNCR